LALLSLWEFIGAGLRAMTMLQSRPARAKGQRLEDSPAISVIVVES
jgi:hypothetical protein